MLLRLILIFLAISAISANAVSSRKCAERVINGEPLTVEFDGKDYDIRFKKPRTSMDRLSSIKVIDPQTHKELDIKTFPDGAKLMLSTGQYLVINHPDWSTSDDYYYAYGSDYVRFDASDIEFTPKDGKSPIHGHLLSAGATGSAYLIEEGEGVHDVLKRYHMRYSGTNVRPQLLNDYSALKSINERKEDNESGFEIIKAELVEYESESPFQITALEPMLRLPFIKGRSVHEIVMDKSVGGDTRRRVAEVYRRRLQRFEDFLRLVFPDGSQFMDSSSRAILFRDGQLDGLPVIKGRVSEKVRTEDIAPELKDYYADPLNENSLIHKDGTTIISHPLIIKSDNVFVDLEDPELKMILIDPF